MGHWLLNQQSNSQYQNVLRLCLVPENTKEIKKNVKENDFFMFGCPMKNIKENQI